MGMGTITLPNFRTTADVTMNTRLKDGGVSIDWAGLTNIKAWLFSDAQKAIAGRCDVSINQADSTLLVCEYSASKPQYLGVNRLILQAKYQGRTKTYDVPVFNFVSRTAAATGTVTIDDPTVDVEIEVEDVSSSILDNILAACIKATEEAKDVVDVHRGPQGLSAYEVAVQDGYEGTEEEWLASLQGPTGPQGIQGVQGIQGETGPAGATGPQGKSAYQVAVEEGFEGDEEAWLASLVGPQGPQGETGAAGAKGDKGDTGATGPQGETGATGATGAQGPKGETGATPAFSIGTVTTGEPGTQASANISGTAEEPVLNLTIPRGDTGVAPVDLQDAVDEYLEEHPTVTGTFNNAAKRALVALLRKVAFIDANGQDYIDELEDELFMGEVDHIEAVFTQGANVIYDFYNLDRLKEFLVVTAFYTDGTSEVVNSYMLSGTLASGTSTITVTFEEATDTFSVTVVGTVKLYMDGNEYSSLTGGWQTKGFNLTNASPRKVKQEDCLLLIFDAASTSAAAASFSTTNQINLTGLTKVFFEVEAHSDSGGGSSYAYWPATLSEGTTQAAAYGSDYSSNRNWIGDPVDMAAGETVIIERNIGTSRTNAYLSINLNLYAKNSVGFSAGSYIKIKKVCLAP